MSWYQPPYAAVYPAGHLRRYNGNPQNPDKIRAYCVGARDLNSGELSTDTYRAVTAGDRTRHGILSVAGATTMAAGVIAYGVASLAF